jgi:hypothetical protein
VGVIETIILVLIVLRQISQYKSTAPETNKRIVRETVVALFSRVWQRTYMHAALLARKKKKRRVVAPPAMPRAKQRRDRVRPF